MLGGDTMKSPIEEARQEFMNIANEGRASMAEIFWRGVAIGALSAGRLNAEDLAKLANPIRQIGTST